jgi:hypothetical protein
MPGGETGTSPVAGVQLVRKIIFRIDAATPPAIP